MQGSSEASWPFGESASVYMVGTGGEENSGSEETWTILSLLSTSTKGCGDPVHPHTTLPVVPALVTEPSCLPLGLFHRETSSLMSADGGRLGLIFRVLLLATVDVT